jgi:hypothetical protein
MANTTSPTFRAYIVDISGGRHTCTYVVVASSRQGATAIALDCWNQLLLGAPTDNVQIMKIIEPGGVMVIHDSYEDMI